MGAQICLEWRGCKDRPPRLALLFVSRLAGSFVNLPPPGACLVQITDILAIKHRKLRRSSILAAKLYCDPCTLLD